MLPIVAGIVAIGVAAVVPRVVTGVAAVVPVVASVAVQVDVAVAGRRHGLARRRAAGGRRRGQRRVADRLSRPIGAIFTNF